MPSDRLFSETNSQVSQKFLLDSCQKCIIARAEMYDLGVSAILVLFQYAIRGRGIVINLKYTFYGGSVATNLPLNYCVRN